MEMICKIWVLFGGHSVVTRLSFDSHSVVSVSCSFIGLRVPLFWNADDTDATDIRG